MTRSVRALCCALLLAGAPGCAALRSLAASPAVQSAAEAADLAASAYLAMRDKLPVAQPPARPAGSELSDLALLLDFLARVESWCLTAQGQATDELGTGQLDVQEVAALVELLHGAKVRALEAQRRAFADLAP